MENTRQQGESGSAPAATEGESGWCRREEVAYRPENDRDDDSRNQRVRFDGAGALEGGRHPKNRGPEVDVCLARKADRIASARSDSAPTCAVFAQTGAGAEGADFGDAGPGSEKDGCSQVGPEAASGFF